MKGNRLLLQSNVARIETHTQEKEKLQYPRRSNKRRTI